MAQPERRVMSEPQLVAYQMVLLRRTRQYQHFDDESRERIFREHLAYTLSRVQSGDQVAAGPVPDGPAEEETICGVGLYQKESLDEVRQLLEQDPGVKQGLYTFQVMTWLTAPGTVNPPSAGWVEGR
jgi:uncharacterized protein YciI